MPVAFKDAAKAGDDNICVFAKGNIVFKPDVFVTGPGVQLAVLSKLKEVCLGGKGDYGISGFRLGQVLCIFTGNILAVGIFRRSNREGIRGWQDGG